MSVCTSHSEIDAEILILIQLSYRKEALAPLQDFTRANFKSKQILESEIRAFFKTATDRHLWKQTNALKQQKNDIGFVESLRRTATKSLKDKNRKVDTVTPCAHGRPRQHIQ